MEEPAMSIPAAAPVPEPPTGGEVPISGPGTMHVAERVVAKIAGVVASQVRGVHRLGGTARALGVLRERIPGAGTHAGQGVHVEVGDRQAAIDLSMIVEYGVAIADLATETRRNVLSALERITGLEVVEVNIIVVDVRLPSDDTEVDTGRRSGEPHDASSISRPR